MSRRTRSEFLASRPKRDRRVGFHEALAMVQRQIKRKAIADGVIVDPARRLPRNTWFWTLDGRSGSVRADTRSQARSLVKDRLGLRRKDRLPLDIIITKGPEE